MNPNKTTPGIPEADLPQEPRVATLDNHIAQTLKLGEEVVGLAGGLIDLARTEALLAINSLPKLMMLWLIMMPIILLTWCSFSVLAGWLIMSFTGELGLGILTFFLMQVLLLVICRVLFVKYRARMTFPYTRTHIDNIMRSIKYEIKRQGETKE